MKPCILEPETLYWTAEIISISTGQLSKVLLFCSQLTPSPSLITQWDQSIQLEHRATSHWSWNEFSKCLGANHHIFLPFPDNFQFSFQTHCNLPPCEWSHSSPLLCCLTQALSTRNSLNAVLHTTEPNNCATSLIPICDAYFPLKICMQYTWPQFWLLCF